MIDPKVLVAVKVFSSEALFNLRHQYTWINEELADQIRFLMKDGSAAIQTRGKKLLAGFNSSNWQANTIFPIICWRAEL